MITQIKGKLIEKTPAYVVIDCNGIGYLIHISLNTYAHLPNDEACLLFTHFTVREDAQTLYGFADRDERRLFRYLISVSGVGPSTAQLVLSSMLPLEIRNAILTDNAAAIQRVKGIGAKTAQRIIIDLRDKIAKEGMVQDTRGSSDLVQSNKTYEDALSALQMLGFNKGIADKAIGKVLKSEGADLTVEQLIKSSLKNL